MITLLCECNVISCVAKTVTLPLESAKEIQKRNRILLSKKCTSYARELKENGSPVVEGSTWAILRQKHNKPTAHMHEYVH